MAEIPKLALLPLADGDFSLAVWYEPGQRWLLIRPQFVGICGPEIVGGLLPLSVVEVSEDERVAEFRSELDAWVGE